MSNGEVLRGYLFMASPARRDWVQRLLLEGGKVTVHQSLDDYPDAQALRHLGRQFEPEVVFLDMKDPAEASYARGMMQDTWPNTAWVPVPAGLPDSPGALEAQLYQAVHARPPAPGARVIALVPAKAGCGASTLAWNVAHACAAQARTLLLEADLRSGALSFVWNKELMGSTQAALRMAELRDDHAALHSVMTLGRLDLLLSSRTAMQPPPEWTSFWLLLGLLRPRYDFVFVDLPELINPASAELTRVAESVLVVTTPELLPLKLAEHRCAELEQWGVPKERIRLALNRAQRNELSAKDVENNLRRPVAAAFPNDYAAVRKSVIGGSAVSGTSALGEAVRAYAASLAPAAEPKDSGLLGYFRRFTAGPARADAPRPPETATR